MGVGVGVVGTRGPCRALSAGVGPGSETEYGSGSDPRSMELLCPELCSVQCAVFECAVRSRSHNVVLDASYIVIYSSTPSAIYITWPGRVDFDQLRRSIPKIVVGYGHRFAGCVLGRSLESVRGLANPARPGLIDSKKNKHMLQSWTGRQARPTSIPIIHYIFLTCFLLTKKQK
jgi:hypothetical protein